MQPLAIASSEVMPWASRRASERNTADCPMTFATCASLAWCKYTQSRPLYWGYAARKKSAIARNSIRRLRGTQAICKVLAGADANPE
jgi:hypothetical protein